MLKAIETEEGLDLAIFRPLAFGLVKLFQSTKITPSQLTFISLVLGLMSGACFWQGTPHYLLWGAGLLFLTNLFDCADGMLARARGTGSLTGYLFDGLVDYTTNASVLIGILHGLSASGTSSSFILLVGVPAGLSFAWWCAKVDRFRNEWLDKVYHRRRDPKIELAEMRAQLGELPPRTHYWDRILIWTYGCYVRLWYSAPSMATVCPGGELTVTEWQRVRRPILRAAVLMGPTMHLSLMMLAGVFDLLRYYLWFSLVFGTAYGLAVLAWRTMVDRGMQACLNGEANN